MTGAVRKVVGTAEDLPEAEIRLSHDELAELIAEKVGLATGLNVLLRSEKNLPEPSDPKWLLHVRQVADSLEVEIRRDNQELAKSIAGRNGLSPADPEWTLHVRQITHNLDSAVEDWIAGRYGTNDAHDDRATAFRNIWNTALGVAAHRKELDESTTSGYTDARPPSRSGDASRKGMGEDFKTRVKKAKAENLAREKPRLSATHQLATYKALVGNVDLLNPDLPEAERLTRARRLVHAYERLHARRPNFDHHNNKQLLAAFSIVNKEKYRRSQAKKAAQKATLAM